MSNPKNAKKEKNQKSEENQIKDFQKEISKIEGLNLNEDLMKKLSELNISEKLKKERESIYIYPDSIPKELRNQEIGKNWRNKRRKELGKFQDRIICFAKYNRIPELKEEIEKFKNHYKTYYSLNDFSIKSISQQSDEKNLLIGIMLEIIKSNL